MSLDDFGQDDVEHCHAKRYAYSGSSGYVCGMPLSLFIRGLCCSLSTWVARRREHPWCVFQCVVGSPFRVIGQEGGAWWADAGPEGKVKASPSIFGTEQLSNAQGRGKVVELVDGSPHLILQLPWGELFGLECHVHHVEQIPIVGHHTALALELVVDRCAGEWREYCRLDLIDGVAFYEHSRCDECDIQLLVHLGHLAIMGMGRSS